ncbi:MAG: GTPase Era [Candidatus Omnitrophica bacterium]|nr:GTPase Era [Candidatus Omnitrophota bacterium]
MKRSGFVAIAGQPNVGKSTMLNGFLMEKVAIISPRPETTRDIIKGIYTEDSCQIVFLDTPGIHKPHDLLGKVMLSRAQSSLMDSDIILFVTEKRLAFNDNDMKILDRLPEKKEGKTVLLVINKIDRVRDKSLILPMMDKAQKLYPFDEIVPVCAKKRSDLVYLLKIIKRYLPEGEFLYPEDELTDRGTSFLIQEIVREKVLLLAREEVPHSVAVVVDELKEEDGVLTAYTTVFAERAGQKAIIIGKNGEMIKKIRRYAETDIQNLFGRKIALDLWVKVHEKWKKDPHALREMGYTD